MEYGKRKRKGQETVTCWGQQAEKKNENTNVGYPIIWSVWQMKTNERAKNGSQRCRWRKGKEKKEMEVFTSSPNTHQSQRVVRLKQWVPVVYLWYSIKNYSDCEWIFLPKKKYLTKENSQELQVLHKWDGSEEYSDLQQGSNETYLTDQDRWGMYLSYQLSTN